MSEINSGFYIKMDNCKFLINILKSLQFKDLATIFATKDGLKITVEDSKCCQGNLFLQDSLFQRYKLTGDCVSFTISLAILIECLSIFGSGSGGSCTSLVMTYKTDTASLEMFLEESGVVTQCRVRTMGAVETLDFDFSARKTQSQLIMKAEFLKEAFAELDMSSDVVQLLISRQAPFLRISTFGSAGSAHSDLARESLQMERFEVESAQAVIVRFKLALLRHVVKPLQLAHKVSLRTDQRNFLCLQLMLPATSPDSHDAAFIEFFCVPDEDEDENHVEEES